MTRNVDPDFKTFVECGAPATSMGEDSVVRRVTRDLVASPFRVALAYVGVSACGYVASLALCAQNDVGILPFSHAVAARMHVIPWPWCPLLCGALFSAVPALLGPFLFTRFQMRFLLTRFWWLIAGLPLLASLVLVATGNNDVHAWFEGGSHVGFSPNLWMILWTAGALGTPWILEGLRAFLLLSRCAKRSESGAADGPQIEGADGPRSEPR
ncbi:MAG: hypothetical protein IOD12_14185 [Silvanigrellales bacterium]|nr:hypothetical protein [Silvanigrellales bacterium]